MSKYDLVVIGGGPGGYVAAEYAAKQGLHTLIIESENYGGVCLNKGCIPTKTLLKSSKINEYIHDAEKYGIEGLNVEGISLNWNKIQERKNKVVKQLQMGIIGLMNSAKVDALKGVAKVIDKNTLVVNDTKIEFDKLIVATGSSPRKFTNIPGFEEGYNSGKLITSDEALKLPEIPKKFTVIGGGVIGVEFATLYANLGSEVTILQGVDRILEVLDGDVSKEITNLLLKENVKIITNINLVEFKDNKVVYTVNGETFTNEADVTLVSVGRVPTTECVKDLPIEFAPNGSIITDAQMRTKLDNIFAIGDCTSKIMLAHTAHKNAIVAVDTILNKPNKYEPLTVPSCIYTHPEVASVGYTEEQLIEKNIKYYKAKTPMAHIGKALADGEVNGFLKLLVGVEHGEILGCHIVASTASDIIAEVALAMELEATVYDLTNTIHPHPTISEIVWETARKILVTNFKDKKWF